MIARGMIVWLVVIAAEIFHGVARTALLEPHLGDVRARQFGVFTGSLMILAIALLFARWVGASSRRDLVAVGAVWLALTLTFEIAFGRLVLNHSWDRLWSDYNLADGGFLGIGMILLALSPLIAARIRGIRRA